MGAVPTGLLWRAAGHVRQTLARSPPAPRHAATESEQARRHATTGIRIKATGARRRARWSAATPAQAAVGCLQMRVVPSAVMEFSLILSSAMMEIPCMAMAAAISAQ